MKWLAAFIQQFQQFACNIYTTQWIARGTVRVKWSLLATASISALSKQTENTFFALLATWSSVALSTLAFKDIRSKVNACSSIAARIA